MELTDQFPGEQLGVTEKIPEDLAYLKALYIQVQSNDVIVVLDKCNVSVGVGMEFSSAEYPPKRIELWWDEATKGAPYARGREIFWSE